MKTSFISLLLAFLCFYTFGQAPEGFNYQGIARDSKGKELSNTTISLRLSIIQDSAAGTTVFTETHLIVTNSYGLFTVRIGAGKLISGNFSKIQWATGLYFLKVEMDAAGGSNYIFLGTSQLLSVPFTLMANRALKSLNDLDTSAINELQILKLSNDTLYLDKGGFVYLGNYNDKNAIQQIKDKLNADSAYLDTKINDESTKRQNNDNNLNQKIISDSNYLKGLINTNTTNINNETNSRITGDQNLKTKQVSDSNYLRTMLNTTNTNLTTETNSRIAADNSLKSKHASDSTYLKGLITTETTNRTNTDNTLQTNINNLRIKEANDSSLFAGYLTTTINSLTTETTNRTNADNTLQSNITGEANNRISADNGIRSKVVSDSTYLKGLIAIEISTRSNADNTLQSNINNETNARILGDNALRSKVVSDSSYLKGQINSHINADHDTSSTNEIQLLSIKNDTILLSKNGGYIKLPTPTNSIVPSSTCIMSANPIPPNGYSYCGTNLSIPDKYTVKSNIPTAKRNAGVITFNNRIYCIGGNNGSNETFSYDPITDSFTQKANLPTARNDMAVALYNNKIYAIAGCTGGSYTATNVNEMYDPDSNKWYTKAPLPSAGIGSSRAVVLNNKIYVFTGLNVNEYNPVNNTWTSKSTLPTTRYGYTIALYNNKIFVIGGQNTNFLPSTFYATNEVYDPATNTWVSKRSMATTRSVLGSTVLNNKIYTIGGWIGGSSVLNTVEEYDPLTDTWHTKTGMGTSRGNIGVDVVRNKIYIIGGNNTVDLNTNEEYDVGKTFYIHCAN